jgi:hypothetical protein
MRHAVTLFFIATITSAALVHAQEAQFCPAGEAGFVASIEKAPIVADGDVAGKPADFVITLDGSLDPFTPGRSLLSGDQIRVIFPPDFDLGNLDPAYPLSDVPNPFPPTPPLPDMPCVPGNLQCSTAVILHGWPQQPVFPPVAFHTLSIDTEENSLIFTAVQDILPDPPALPGIKQLHLIMNGLANPKPGRYMIRVEAQTGPGGSWESGSAIYRVRRAMRPSVNPTSVLVKAQAGLLEGGPACGPGTLPPNPDNPLYQATGVGEAAPFMWTLLLWGRDAEPLDDVTLRWVDPNHARLRRDGRTVGHVFIDAPIGAEGYDIMLNPLGCPTMIGAAPVIADTPGIGPQPAGRLDMLFITGSEPGDYTTTITMSGSTSTTKFVVTAE